MHNGSHLSPFSMAKRNSRPSRSKSWAERLLRPYAHPRYSPKAHATCAPKLRYFRVIPTQRITTRPAQCMPTHATGIHPDTHTRPPPRVGCSLDLNGTYCPALTCNTFSNSLELTPPSDLSHFFCIKYLQLKPTFIYALHNSIGTFNTA